MNRVNLSLSIRCKKIGFDLEFEFKTETAAKYFQYKLHNETYTCTSLIAFQRPKSEEIKQIS